MNWLDIVILVVIALGAFRGMSVGIIGAAIVAAGGFVGWMLAGQLSDDIGGIFDDLSNDTLVTTVSYVVIIAASIAVASYLGKIIRPILTVATLGLSAMVDKLGGLALGVVFGVAVASALIVVMARFTYDFELPDEGLAGSVAGSVGSQVPLAEKVEETKETLEDVLAGSAIVPVFVDIVDAVPASAMGFVPSDFKASLDILKEKIDEE
ncbi:MAG: CvpA family protein [Chloroflexi bacterium]|nr:CvpA family protein [Chloroflexota bacterium]